MAATMEALVRFRKGDELRGQGIPADVHKAYARLYEVSWEAVLKLPAGMPT
jgi:hypothetical protein